jgi:hypothetical protein
MQNDSIETLLFRHYGSNAPAPEYLEQRLLRSVQQEARVLHKQQQHLQTRRISRRQVVRMVAIGSAGLGLLSAGLESLQQVETALARQDVRPAAFS